MWNPGFRDGVAAIANGRKHRNVIADGAQLRPSTALPFWLISDHPIFYPFRQAQLEVVQSIVLRVDRGSTRVQGLDSKPGAHDLWPGFGAKIRCPTPNQRRIPSNQVVSAAPNCLPAQTSAPGIAPTLRRYPQVGDISASRWRLDPEIEDLEQIAANCSTGKAKRVRPGQFPHAPDSNAHSRPPDQVSDSPL